MNVASNRRLRGILLRDHAGNLKYQGSSGDLVGPECSASHNTLAGTWYFRPESRHNRGPLDDMVDSKVEVLRQSGCILG
jgi:hypothetical protein